MLVDQDILLSSRSGPDRQNLFTNTPVATDAFFSPQGDGVIRKGCPAFVCLPDTGFSATRLSPSVRRSFIGPSRRDNPARMGGPAHTGGAVPFDSKPVGLTNQPGSRPVLKVSVTDTSIPAVLTAAAPSGPPTRRSVHFPCRSVKGRMIVLTGFHPRNRSLIDAPSIGSLGSCLTRSCRLTSPSLAPESASLIRTPHIGEYPWTLNGRDTQIMPPKLCPAQHLP